MNPMYSFLGSTDVTKYLPRLNKNNRANLILWNTLIAGGTFGSAFALIKALANETHKEQWAKKQKTALDAKLGSIMPSATPDTNVTEDDRNKRKRQAALALADLQLDTNMDKNASALEDFVAKVLAPLTPVVAAGGASILATKAVDDAYKKDRESELDAQISEYETELETLQSRILKARSGTTPEQGSDTTNSMYKEASSIGELLQQVRTMGGLLKPRIKTKGDTTIAEFIKQYPLLSALTVATPVSVAAYSYFNNKDEDDKKFKVMQDMAATNMSNIPPRLSLALDKDGNPVVTSNEK